MGNYKDCTFIIENITDEEVSILDMQGFAWYPASDNTRDIIIDGDYAYYQIALNAICRPQPHEKTFTREEAFAAMLKYPGRCHMQHKNFPASQYICLRKSWEDDDVYEISVATGSGGFMRPGDYKRYYTESTFDDGWKCADPPFMNLGVIV